MNCLRVKIPKRLRPYLLLTTAILPIVVYLERFENILISSDDSIQSSSESSITIAQTEKETVTTMIPTTTNTATENFRMEENRKIKEVTYDKNVKIFLQERERVYKERKETIEKGCEYYRITHPDIYRSISQLKSIIYTRSDKFHLLWIQVPKAGSRSWVINFEVLKENGDEEIRLDHGINIRRNLYDIVEFWKSPKTREEYLSFTFVRHPFSRVLSAYLDKMEYSSTNFSVQEAQISKRIVSRYRSEENKKNINSTDCTFPEFVEYLVTEGVNENIHWRPAARMIYPCTLDFDVLGNLETFNEDSNYLIHKMKLEHLLQVPWSNKHHHGENVEKLYYSKITRKQLDSLYNRYELEFRLFGYDPSEYYKLVKP